MLEFLGDVYLSQTLNHIEECWVGAGGVSVYISLSFHFMPSLFLDGYLFSSSCPTTSPSFLL
jgi:hypothetical protein